MVIDFDDVDECLKIGLSDRPSADVIPHVSTESLNKRGINADLVHRILFGPFQGRARALTIGLKRFQPIGEYFIQIGQTILRSMPQPPQSRQRVAQS